MKRVALDTNIAVDILNNVTTTIIQLEKYDVFYLPITVCGELLFGALNSKKQYKNRKRFKAFIKSHKSLNSNMRIAEEYAAIRLSLKQKGRPIPENDIWIASICKINKIPLATKDNHFRFIEGLKVIKFLHTQ